MAKITAEQLQSIIAALSGIVTTFNPAVGATVGVLIGSATQLNNMLRQIRTENPEVWEQVRTNFGAALAEFEASEPRQP